MFINLTTGVAIPDEKVCKQHTTPWRAFADAYFGRNPVAVWKASRGFGGKTYTLGLLSWVEVITQAVDVNILGGSGEQSNRVHEYTQEFWRYRTAPKHLLAGDPTARETRLVTGAKIRALMASMASVRGPHPVKLRLDEIDEMELEILNASLGQPMGKDGIDAHTVMSSTHQYANRTMTNVLQRASERGWPVYTWCLDGDSHIMSAGGPILMKNIKTGDRIYAHKDGKLIQTNVVDAWCSGSRSTLIIQTTQGELICTPEHKILTIRGWQRADQLKCGDLVQAVRDPQSTNHKNRQSSCARFVPNLFGKQALSPMRKVDYASSIFVQQVPLENKYLSQHESDQDSMPKLWGEKDDKVKTLSCLLSQGDSPAQYANCGCNGQSSSADSSERQLKKETEQIRDSSSRIVRSTRAGISERTRNRPLRCGFSSAEKEGCYRSQRAILAFERRPKETRSGKGRNNQEGGFASDCSLGRQNPSLGLAIVQGVRSGPVCSVYDLTVEDGESFIANGIIVHNCYRETKEPHGWLSLADIASKKQTVTQAMWDNEYELQDPSPETRAINTASVQKMFLKKLGNYKGKNQQYIEIEPPLVDAEYSTGADWAKRLNWTVIVTVRTDVDPMKVVAFERCGRMKWPIMVGKLNRRLERYNGACAHDAVGIGDVVDDYLEHDVIPFVMMGKRRSNLLTQYIAAVERDEMVSPHINFMEGEHRLSSVDDVYSPHTPDSIVAMAMAYYAIGKERWSRGPAA